MNPALPPVPGSLKFARSARNLSSSSASSLFDLCFLKKSHPRRLSATSATAPPATPPAIPPTFDEPELDELEPLLESDEGVAEAVAKTVAVCWTGGTNVDMLMLLLLLLLEEELLDEELLDVIVEDEEEEEVVEEVVLGQLMAWSCRYRA